MMRRTTNDPGTKDFDVTRCNERRAVIAHKLRRADMGYERGACKFY